MKELNEQLGTFLQCLIDVIEQRDRNLMHNLTKTVMYVHLLLIDITPE